MIYWLIGMTITCIIMNFLYPKDTTDGWVRFWIVVNTILAACTAFILGLEF